MNPSDYIFCIWKGLNDEKEVLLSTLMSGWQLDTEMEWMRQYLEQLKSPVVFCHNDLQEGNILIREKAASREEKLVIIDFEYCSYNYRGFDVANHFCESVYDYTNDKSPKFFVNEANMPSIQQKVTSFIRDLFIHSFTHSLIHEWQLIDLVCCKCRCTLFARTWTQCNAKWEVTMPWRPI